jgi:hypothetical protein
MSLSGDAGFAFTKMYLLAGRIDAGGALADRKGPLDIRRLSWHLRISPDELDKCLPELLETGLLILDGDEYRIANFMEEQGPGDNVQRQKWRDRQRKHRERLRLKELDKDLDIEVEQEKRREREDSHRDVTVTFRPAPAPPSSADAFYLDIKHEGNYDNGLSNDDPFSTKIVGALEFAMNALLAQAKFQLKQDDIPVGYFKVTAKGVEKIKEFYDNDVEKINDEKLTDAIDFWFWYCQEKNGDIFDIDNILRLCDEGVSRERLKYPEVYRQTAEVQVIKEVTGKEPPTQLMPKIYDSVNLLNPFKYIEIFNEYYQTWIGRGYKDTNYDWLFDWYVNEKDIWNEYEYPEDEEDERQRYNQWNQLRQATN